MKADRKRRFGEALVQAGVLDRNEIGRSVARQVNRIVLSLFELKDGVASFEERRCTIPLEYMVSLSVHRLLYEGIRFMKERDLVLAGLGKVDRWVELAAIPPFTFDLKGCTEEETELLEQSRRRVTVRRLAWAPGGLAFSRLRGAWVKQARFDRQHPSSRTSRTGLPRRFATPMAPRHVAAPERVSAPSGRSRATRRALHATARPRALAPPLRRLLVPRAVAPAPVRVTERRPAKDAALQYGGPRLGGRRGTSVASPTAAR